MWVEWRWDDEVEVEMKWVKCKISKSNTKYPNQIPNIKYQISKSNIQLNMKSKSDRPTDRQSKIEMKLELMMWVEWRWDNEVEDEKRMSEISNQIYYCNHSKFKF